MDEKPICNECGAEIPSMQVSNVHGIFCSKPCIDSATKRGYPKAVLDALADLENCLVDAPVDFLGTGSNSKAADKEEGEWRQTWERAIAELKAYVTKCAR